jgi:hypothetical protein
MFGGGTLLISGTGFVEGLRDSASGRALDIRWASPPPDSATAAAGTSNTNASSSSSSPAGLCAIAPGFTCALPSGLPTPPVAAVAAGLLPISLAWSNSSAAVVQLGRFSLRSLARAAVAAAETNGTSPVTTAAAYGSWLATAAAAGDLSHVANASAGSVLVWQLRVTETATTAVAAVGPAGDGDDSGGVVHAAAEGRVAMCAGLTPWIHGTTGRYCQRSPERLCIEQRTYPCMHFA